MYGELRNTLNACASKFNAIALQLEESHHTKARFWEPLARHMQLMPEQRSRDYAVAPTKKNLCKETLLLQFIQRQISLNNFECAAACAIQWRDELSDLNGYVSRETLFGLKRRCE